MPDNPAINIFIVVLLAAAGSAAAVAQPAAGPDRDRAMVTAVDEDALQSGTIEGVLVDASTGQTVPGAVVRIRELERNRVTALDGSFVFGNLPPRTYTLTARHLGFAPASKIVRVGEDETLQVRLEISPSVLEHPGVVVTGTGRERGVSEAYKPTAVLTGTELQRHLESSVAATISHVPGISQQYNGPGAATPVIRGMGGDRVLVLEDGQRTGDLATTGADHGNIIDPVTSERIEVVRGPAGLLYGSNALGGVINVIRNDVPRSLPEATRGMFTAKGESVAMGASSGLALSHAVGRLALRGELSGRMAGDVRTPLGELPATDMKTMNASAGLSWIPDWGFVGVSGRQYSGRYGVPGEFQGELIPGAHPGGVDIEFTRRLVRFRAGHLRGIGVFSNIEFDANLSHYLHDEIEGRGLDQPFFGARFDQITGGANLVLHHDHELGEVRTEGAAGAYFYARDLVAIGSHTGSRSAQEWSTAIFAYEEFGFHRFRVQVGARFDYTDISPIDRAPIRSGDRLIEVRPRQFSALSGSASALLDFMPGWTAGISLARAFRYPSIEELYSDGPHLADYSYDIGNPELDAEYGYGADLFVRAQRNRLSLELSTFANRVVNYIYYHPTGEIDQRFFRFPVFEARGEDAIFLGGEGRAKWEFTPRLVLDGTLSYVRATRLGTNDPLPAIPPLNGRLEMRYDRRDLFATVSVRGAAAQHRIPPAIPSPVIEGGMLVPERPTEAYSLVSAGAGYRIIGTRMLHTISLRAENLLDTQWRDHLSRVKDVVPQPGRNIQLVYRVEF